MLQHRFEAGFVVPTAVEGREDVLDLVLGESVEQAHQRVEFRDQVVLLGRSLTEPTGTRQPRQPIPRSAR